jgi:AmmeMemoRadiSam system protein B
VICLHDPAGFADKILVLPIPLLDIVSLFDGTRTVLEIQEYFMRSRGELLPHDKIEQVIHALDEQGFLDSRRFAERRRSIEERFRSSPTRQAAHAGATYAGEPEALRAQIDAFFAHPDGPAAAGRAIPSDPVRALIAPHIDFSRGGPTYAWAYRDLAERCDADLFVILGTCHAGMEDPFALTLKDYETPLGPAAIDREFADQLTRRSRLDLFKSELAHRAEHSIEFQCVMLRRVFASRREFSIVPILASFLHERMASGKDPESDPEIAGFLDALRETVAASRRKICLVAGADLAHVGPRFGDPHPATPAFLQDVERADREMLEAVARCDAGGFYESVARDGDSRRICGLSPIYALLRTTDATSGVLLHYAQWPDPQGAVTFASLAFPA